MNTYAGFRSVPDVLVGWDQANEKEIVSTQEHFVRCIKLTLHGKSDYPGCERAGPDHWRLGREGVDPVRHEGRDRPGQRLVKQAVV
ncbi:hypothetical protein [Streptomyces sp. NPDC060022]|uniref:hypothetical protein n=1 Tax=Streptomyces sp. NPDC060022 TaxID=3347039 RepID=UPI0036BF93A9